MGATLKKRGDGGYVLDLTEPGLHKTSAAMGPSLTTLSTSIVPWIEKWIELTSVSDDDFLFATTAGEAYSPSLWSRLVKAIYKKHCGVAVTPKDLRSIYVTFLKEGDHGEEALRAAAEKMRHTTKMQGSAAYDKSNKLAQTAVAMAANYSAKFRAQ